MKMLASTVQFSRYGRVSLAVAASDAGDDHEGHHPADTTARAVPRREVLETTRSDPAGPNSVRDCRCSTDELTTTDRSPVTWLWTPRTRPEGVLDEPRCSLERR